MDPVEAVVRRGGGCRRSELLTSGLSRRSIDAAVAAGRLAAVGRGGLVAPGAPGAVVAATRLRARVGCLSAVELAGLPLLIRPEVPHLLCSRSRAEAGVHWHRRAASQLVQELPAAVLEVVRCRPPLEGLATVDAVLHQRLCQEPELLSHRQQREAPKVGWVLEHADAAAESPLESALRGLLVEAGIRGVQPQAQLAGVGRVDLLVHGWLVLEADGYEFHRGRTDYRTDRRRTGAATILGYITLRFSYEDIVGSPQFCVAAVRAALSRRRRRAFSTAI